MEEVKKEENKKKPSNVYLLESTSGTTYVE